MVTGQKITVTTSKTQKNNTISLSIQVSLNGLSFCALDTENRRILYFKDQRFHKKLNPIQTLQQIEKAYEEDVFLEQPFKEVKLLFSNELYSLVPEKLFREENASDYLKFNARILETEFVAHDPLPEQGLVNVYIPYTNISNYFFEKYGEFEYQHCVSVLVRAFLEADKNMSAGTRVYLNRNASGYDLVVIRKGKLLFSNSFMCDTKEDFIYYLLFTAEQLELDPEEFELVLLGNITENSDYYKMAYTYIRNISFLKTSFGFIFDIGTSVPKGYKYFTIFSSFS